MAKEMLACDGRRQSNRLYRIKYRCTHCGHSLPTKRRYWGLVWESNFTGICLPCLKLLRLKVGVLVDIEEEDGQ
jgi:hypothetical protein